jgi:hypothetical protein
MPNRGLRIVLVAFGAARTPECFLFDAEMKLAYHGGIDDDARAPDQVKKRYRKDALAAVTAGKTVETAKTPAPGCSIKWRKKVRNPAE